MRGRLLLLPAVGMALAGCTPGPGRAPQAAGAAPESADFGAATRRNNALMTGERRLIVDLTEAFASEVPARITFAFDSAALGRRAQAALDRQAAWIRSHPGIRFRVYGHTDRVGSTAYNERLGLRRARAAVAYLVSHGVDRRLLEAVVSRGETEPLVLTSGRARRNRRTVTEVSGFARAGGMTFDGRYMAEVYADYIESAQPEHDQQFELEQTEGG